MENEYYDQIKRVLREFECYDSRVFRDCGGYLEYAALEVLKYSHRPTPPAPDAAALSPPRRIRIDPQPEQYDGLWYYAGDVYVSDEDLESHLFHDVYGNYKANGVAEAETAAPVLVGGVWYWEIRNVGP